MMKRGVLDEAGDVGWSEGASRYLVVAIVLTDNLHQLGRVAVRTRKRLGKRLKDIPELKAWHTPRKVVMRLLEDVARLDVEIVTVIPDKGRANRPDDPEDWYRKVCARAVSRCLEQYQVLSLTVDKRYTRRSLEERLLHSLIGEVSRLSGGVFCEFAASEREKAIQVADAVAWAVFQKYERSDETFYRIIRDRIVVEEIL